MELVGHSGTERLRLLEAALRMQSRHLTEIDASSGCLPPGSFERIISPLLQSQSCALRTLICPSLPRGSAWALARSLQEDTQLRELALGSCSFNSEEAKALASALAVHPCLTAVSLEHNPVWCGDCPMLAITRHNTQSKRMGERVGEGGWREGICGEEDWASAATLLSQESESIEHPRVRMHKHSSPLFSPSHVL